MKLFALGCVFLARFIHVMLQHHTVCILPLHGENERNAPLILQSSSPPSILMPKNGTIIVSALDMVTLACPGRRNSLIGTSSNMEQVQCLRGKSLHFLNQDVSFDQVQCKFPIKGELLKTTTTCGNGRGHNYEIGYNVESGFIAMINVCYDQDLGGALYTEHFLVGSEIKYASKSSFRPNFNAGGASVNVAAAYRDATKTFQKVLRCSKYVNETSFLARGHLSPDADFLFASAQYTSYFYINAVPQWQTINGGNWKKIEGMVRRVAQNLSETLKIVTGTHDVLVLSDDDRLDREIYLLSNNKLPVPKFVWKIVYSTVSRKAVVLIILNNPFKQRFGVLRVGKGDYLCEDICDQAGWSSASWSNFQSGFVYCCDYNEFVKEVATAPKLAVVGVLHGRNN